MKFFIKFENDLINYNERNIQKIDFGQNDRNLDYGCDVVWCQLMFLYKIFGNNFLRLMILFCSIYKNYSSLKFC